MRRSGRPCALMASVNPPDGRKQKTSARYNDNLLNSSQGEVWAICANVSD